MEQSAESAFLDAVNELFVAFDDSGALRSHNRVAREVTGYARTELTSMREQLETEERVLREMYEIIADRDRSFAEKVDALLRLERAELETEYASLSRIKGNEYVFEYVDAANDNIQRGDTAPLSATNCKLPYPTSLGV